VDVGVIPEGLIESELFGHAKGAFTGADRSKEGFFSMASGGTLFIDELQNMSPYAQSKLLSVVEDRVMYPVGSAAPVEVDVRIIAATNRDIKKTLTEKKFREDLFFRLGEFMITLPPLRERPEDVEFFARKFASETSSELDKDLVGIEDGAMGRLLAYRWPGNVRELKNVIRRAVLLCDGDTIGTEHLDFILHTGESGEGPSALTSLRDVVRHVERQAIMRAMQLTGGNKKRVAEILEIDYKTLLSKVKDFGLQ
jgi:transcriptional regulator with PAS, ATPase and Fis domain